MATLYNSGSQRATFTPISTALNGLPNGAGTIAALVKKDSAAASLDAGGLLNSANSDWYHALSLTDLRIFDDDGLTGPLETPTWSPGTDWYIIAVTWPAGGAALERFHHISQSSPAGWTHSNSAANNGGNRAGPGTNGHWLFGYHGDFGGSGAIALMAAWAGVALSDAQIEELITNNRTSDWWNNSAGQPTLLIEGNTTSPVDIGANPSTFSSIGGLTLTGATPSWVFDGQGSDVDSLHFSGGSDRREFSQGSVAGDGALSCAMIVKTTGGESAYSWMLRFDAATDAMILGTIDGGTDATLTTYNGTTERQANPTMVIPWGEWYLIGLSKAAGTTTPRYHVYRYGTSTWEHGNFDGTLANYPAPTAGLVWGHAASEAFTGNLLVGAIWDSELSDATFETLELALSAWVDAAPDHLVRFNAEGYCADITGTSVGQVDANLMVGGTPDLAPGDAPSSWDDDVVVADPITIATDNDDGTGYRSTTVWANIESATFVAEATSELWASITNAVGTYYVDNIFLRFLTSSIPDNAIPISADLLMHILSDTSDDGRKFAADFFDFGGEPSIAGDWELFSNADAIRQDYFNPSFITPGIVNTFPLTSLTGINKTGYTGIRIAASTNNQPTGENSLQVASLEHATAQPPILVVRYITPAEEEAAPTFRLVPPMIV
jgi:hypothetical protein